MTAALFLFLFASLLGSTASAQLIPKGNIFGGYSYLRLDEGNGNHNGLNGWAASLEGKVFPLVGIVADFSGHYGTPEGVSTKEYNFLFGPRVSFSLQKFRPFAHALFGVSHINTSVATFSSSQSAFGYALGGGADYKVIPLFSARLQVDYLPTRFSNTTQKNIRFSTGLVFNF
jgi:opacity protein-like surface antigen